MWRLLLALAGLCAVTSLGNATNLPDGRSIPDVVIAGGAPVAASTSAATITSTSTQVLAASSTRVYLSVDNESLTASIACAFGRTAALNTAGSYTIPPGATRVWSGSPIPSDAMNCISSEATSPATIGVY